MTRRKHNSLNDHDLRPRSHSRHYPFQDLDEILIRPAMADMSHHVNVRSVRDLRVEEIVSLVRDLALEIRWKGLLVRLHGLLKILDDEFQVWEFL